MQEKIVLKGLKQNNLKNVNLTIPKNKIVVFTGVSGSGKSSIVFDTIAAESQRQMNDTYPTFIRSRLPKYPKPNCDIMENLSPSVIIDQTPLGSTARSTVGTSSQIYAGLRLLFSRIGQPYAGSASMFSFNDPSGMCQECSGMGMVMDVDLDKIVDWSKSLREGPIMDTTFKVDSWYYKVYVKSGLFDIDKPIKDYTEKERKWFLYGKEGTKVQGIYTAYKKRYITRDLTNISFRRKDEFIKQSLCPCCNGKRLNRIALSCWINGNSISDLCDMELTELRTELLKIKDNIVQELVDNLVGQITRMIDIGLGYLNLSRPTQTLSGGEAQRLRLVRYLGSSLTDMLYIFDEPSTGMHPRDVYRMNNLLKELRDKGNTVLVVEHDEDVISIADEIIDVGPKAGTEGGQIVFQGTYEELLKADTLTAKAMQNRRHIKYAGRNPLDFLPIRNATLHNLKNCDADIPLGCICTISGVAGSGKSSLMQAFTDKYSDRVIKIDQKPITATNRSTPSSYLGFLDVIRKGFADENKIDEGMFSFNSVGACPHCKGKGVIVTELAFMDPIITTCEECNGTRYSKQALSYKHKGKNILDVLSLTAKEAEGFFTDKKILKAISAMNEVGLSYLTLGQPMSTLSGGERQRIKLAASLNKKGNIYLLDEPTTGLHPSDIEKLMELFSRLVEKGNSIILIEHNLEVMKMSDYIIDIGPDGGKNGGKVVFNGTPKQMVENSNTITAECLKMSNGDKCLTQDELRKLSYTLTEDKKEDLDMLKMVPIGRTNCEMGDFKIELDKKFVPALKGLEGFSHIQVLWWFDGCDNENDRNVLINNKPYAKGPDVMGTFATRSPQRPNPIGMSACEIKNIDYEKATIYLYYFDAITGTPILDIKPYTPSADKVENAKVPSWCSHWPKSYEDSGNFNWESEFNF